ncbi:PREDICTED: spindle and kinetochore-associated protein 2-like [Chrysochloris asiatica]|uniref:Protein FAM33A n=1 Tax=Chrysochloris asiatica TaxID=185453 RepID=A0A9B0T669_CHRAS|nr:PREDICTED: spindle and kinetochore-associated protein 2-like [Chrysochloris asiatica]
MGSGRATTVKITVRGRATKLSSAKSSCRPMGRKASEFLGIIYHNFEFQEADSDLDCILYRLEYEIKKYPNSAGGKDPVTHLKKLSAIKSFHPTLPTRFKPVAVEQKEMKGHVYITLNKTMTVIQEMQKLTDLELSPLTEEEKTAEKQLKSHVPDFEKMNLPKGTLIEKTSVSEKFRKMS